MMNRALNGKYGTTTAGWELLRLARKGSPMSLRLFAGLMMLGTMVVMYFVTFPRHLDVNEVPPSIIDSALNNFCKQFAFVFLMLQAALIFFATPMSVGGAIIEEVERKTLDFLLATDLSPSEIILGKLWPRLIQIASLILLGIPILSMTLVWGGVDFLFVALAELCLLASIWSAAGISACRSVGAKSFRQAVLRSFRDILLIQLISFSVWLIFMEKTINSNLPLEMISIATCPVLAIYYCENVVTVIRTTPMAYDDFALALSPIFVFVAIQLIIGWLYLRRSFHKLKHFQTFYHRQKVRVKPLAHWEKHPPVSERSPLLWKELYLSGQASRFVRLMALVPWPIWLCVSAVGTLIMLAALIGGDVNWGAITLMRVGGGFFVLLMCLTAGLHAAGTVSRERQQETLIDLLMIPQARREILSAKWYGSIAKTKSLMVGFLSIPMVSMMADGIDWYSLPCVLLTAFVFIHLSISFGIWLSVRNKSVRFASNSWLVTAGIFIALTTILNLAFQQEINTSRNIPWGGRVEPVDDTLMFANLIVEAVSPLQIWYRVSFRYDLSGSYFSYDSRSYRVDSLLSIVHYLIGLLVLYVASMAFYHFAQKRFVNRNE